MIHYRPLQWQGSRPQASFGAPRELLADQDPTAG